MTTPPPCFDPPPGDPAQLDEAASIVLRATAELGGSADGFGAATGSALEHLDGVRAVELFTFARGTLPLLHQLADAAHRVGPALRSHSDALASAQQELAALRDEWTVGESELLTAGGAAARPEHLLQLERRADELQEDLRARARDVARALRSAGAELDHARRQAERAGLVNELRSLLPPEFRSRLQDAAGFVDSAAQAAGQDPETGPAPEQPHPGSLVDPAELLLAVSAWATREDHDHEASAIAARILAAPATEAGALAAATSQSAPDGIDVTAAVDRLYPHGSGTPSGREPVAPTAARAAAIATGAWGSVARS